MPWVGKVLMQVQVVSNADARVKSGAHASLCVCGVCVVVALEKKRKKREWKKKSREHETSFVQGKCYSIGCSFNTEHHFLFYPAYLLYLIMAHDGSFRDHESYQDFMHVANKKNPAMTFHVANENNPTGQLIHQHMKVHDPISVLLLFTFV